MHRIGVAIGNVAFAHNGEVYHKAVRHNKLHDIAPNAPMRQKAGEKEKIVGVGNDHHGPDVKAGVQQQLVEAAVGPKAREADLV